MPRCARSRGQMLKLQPDSARLAAQHLHRGRGAAQARPRWRRMASHVKPAGPGWSCGTTRLCSRRVRPRPARYASSTSRLLMGAATCSATPFVSVVGQPTVESIASGDRKRSFMMAVTRTSDRDTCALRILMIQNQGPHGARVPSHSVTTLMELASDMRARSSNDRFRPHAYGHGASV